MGIYGLRMIDEALRPELRVLFPFGTFSWCHLFSCSCQTGISLCKNVLECVLVYDFGRLC